MKKKLPFIAIFTVIAALIVAGLLVYQHNNSVTGKLARAQLGQTRLSSHPAGTVSVVLRSIPKEELDGTHGAAICDIGSARLAILIPDLKDFGATFGLDLPISGDSPKQGQEIGGKFSYTYADGWVECRYMDTTFRISSQKILQIGNEGIAINPNRLIIYDPVKQTIKKHTLKHPTSTSV